MGWGSILKAVGKGVGNIFTGGALGDILDAAGKGASGAAQSMANNRGSALDASLTRDQLATGRQAEDRTERDDAWQRLQQAAYVQNAQGYQPPTMHTSQGDRTLSTFDFAPKAPTDAERQGAQGLQSEVMRRLMGGSQLPPLTDIDKYAKQGGWEKLLGLFGAAAPVASASAYAYQNRGHSTPPQD